MQLIIVLGSAIAAGMLVWIKTIKENGWLECSRNSVGSIEGRRCTKEITIDEKHNYKEVYQGFCLLSERDGFFYLYKQVWLLFFV